MEFKLVGEKLLQALCDLIRHDSSLLEIGVNERSMTHRIAVYLEPRFDGFNVDCEYNRDGLNPKLLTVPGVDDGRACSEDIHAVTVYPDIVIHERGSNTRNLLVIEAKKAGHPDHFDREKLAAFREAPYSYRHAALITLSPQDVVIEWIGEEMPKTELKVSTPSMKNG